MYFLEIPKKWCERNSSLVSIFLCGIKWYMNSSNCSKHKQETVFNLIIMRKYIPTNGQENFPY